MKRAFEILVCTILVFCANGLAQEEFNHPELEWSTMTTEHFLIHYHEGAERTADVVSKIAEEIYDPITSLYAHEPDEKVSFIIKDYDDISNGAAYFYDNKIEIYAPSMDFDFRGTHNWLRNVVTHEFTHIIQIQTAMKFGRRMPAFYVQWLGYESERRPDVLYGYPNVIVSTPYSGFVVPAWFAEGVAQYNRKELSYDFWDSHRDMILRSYVLDGNMLTWNQMSVFGKTSLGNESSYNAGFAFVRYLAQRYGEIALAEISRNLSSFGEVTIDGAIEEAVGKSGQVVYDEWREELRNDYSSRVRLIRAHLHEGVPLETTESEAPPPTKENITPASTKGVAFGDPSVDVQIQPCCLLNAGTGFANLYPSFSPDGKHLAYVSTKEADYFSQSSLYVRDLTTGKDKLLVPGIRTALSWSPDGKSLFYGKLTRDNAHWSQQFDIYRYSIDTEKESRITTGHRALSPAVSPDGTMLAFVVGSDGTSNIAVARIDGTDFRTITPYAHGEQAYAPRWSPDGQLIIFDFSVKDGRDIVSVRPDGSDLRPLISGSDDSRSGVFSTDGSKVFFSSDRTGIFNIYALDIHSGSVDQLTNVLGGAFMPTIDPDGNMVYAGYTSGGYKLYRMEKPEGLTGDGYHYLPPKDLEQGEPLASMGEGSISTPVDWSALRSYDDTVLPDHSSQSYKSRFTSLSVVPFIRIDNYNPKNTALETLKGGVYLYANDVLEKTGFFAGIDLNTRLERDLFFQANYRGKIPMLYQLGLEPTASVELYNVTRKTDNFLTLGVDTLPVDVSYDLLEFDFVLNHPFVSQFSNVEFRFIHSRYTSVLESFLLPDAGVLVSGSSDLYLIANDLSLTFSLDAIVPSRTSAINPIGRKVTLRVGRELNKFNGDGEYMINSEGGLSPVYKNVNFTRTELRWKEHLPWFAESHSLTLLLKGGTILGPAVDSFFDFYAGGLPGMKGYPFYSLGGNEFATAGIAYRFPLVSNLDVRFFNFYFDKLYATLYADIGDAWTGDIPNLKEFKTDAGMELRLESFSFYAFPTRIFLNAAYGFDRFTRFIPSRNTSVTYGKEWSVYFGVLFDFDLD